MMPLVGHAFILFAIGWAIFVRGGLSDKSLSEGVAISQGYWGLVVALIAANALVWISAAHNKGCSHQPCFAVASQFDKGGKIPSGVNEYILYLTDGVLIILFLTLAVGLIFVIATMIVYVPSEITKPESVDTSGGAPM